jgi:hypothetical protein
MSRGTWKPDSKLYFGPDEDGKYLHKSEQKKQQRMVEHSNRLSGGRGGEVRGLEERRHKFRLFEKQQKSQLLERSLVDLRKIFKQYDGKDNLLVEIARRKNAEGVLVVTVDNEHITKDRKLSSVVTMGLGKWTNVQVRQIEQNYYLFEVRKINSKSWGMLGEQWEPCNMPESEWPNYVDKYFTLAEDASYYALRINRRDDVRWESVDVKTAQNEIELSQYEIPEKKKRGKK